MKKILFACVHNSGRSQMAEAFFNQISGGRITAISAGTEPGQSVNPVVAEAMLELGIDISRNKPKLLTFEMMEDVDRVITMGCGEAGACPATLAPTEDWELEDPEGNSLEKVRKIRDEIKSRVISLAGELGINNAT